MLDATFSRYEFVLKNYELCERERAHSHFPKIQLDEFTHKINETITLNALNIWELLLLFAIIIVSLRFEPHINHFPRYRRRHAATTFACRYHHHHHTTTRSKI